MPFPSPVRESEVAQSCPTLSDLMDCSLPGSSVHGISQAKVLEWGAIAFSVSSTPVIEITIFLASFTKHLLCAGSIIVSGDRVVTRTHEPPTFIGDVTANKN